MRALMMLIAQLFASSTREDYAELVEPGVR